LVSPTYLTPRRSLRYGGNMSARVGKRPTFVARLLAVWGSYKVIIISSVAIIAFLIFLFTLQNPDQKRLQFYLSQTMTPDIEYCHGQKLDFYAPRKKLPEPSAVILYIHGGGWLINNKQSDPDQMIRLDPLLDENYAFVSIDYRSLPLHHFPEPVEDALCAVRYLKANASKYHIDGEKIMVYGNSAGAHIAAMVGVLGGSGALQTPEYSNYSSTVKGVITIGGQMDFTQEVSLANRARTAWFVNGYEKLKAYPATHVSKQTPSFMLLHGELDDQVHYQQAKIMAKALKEKSVPYQLLIVKHADHGLHPEDGVPQPEPAEINKRMQQFVRLTIQ
jgi:acetyl esterase/lipase